METSAIIQQMFATFDSQVLMPSADGLWSIIPNTLTLVVLATVVSIFIGCSNMPRGAKFGTIIMLFAMAFALPYAPDLLSSLLNSNGGFPQNPASSAATISTLE